MINDIIKVWSEKSDFYIKLLLEHIEIAMIAILIAGIIGLVIGVFIAEYKKTSKLALGIINFIYTIPSISLLGFLIPLSGIGNTTAIIALIIYALLPMVRNTYTGIHNVSTSIIEAATGMGSTRWQVLYKIKLPLALPVIMSGIRNMAVMTIALAGIASFIGAGGLGVSIYRGITTNNNAMTIIGSLLIALLALVVDLILGWIEKSMKQRKESTKRRNRVTLSIIALLCISLFVFNIVSFNKKTTIQIATKPMSEQYVLGEMLSLLIEDNIDVEVKLTQGVGGGTNNIHPGMKSGKFDLYPEYTGTGWNQVLKEKDLYTETLFSKLQSGYQEMGMHWETMLGFNNTYGIAVKKEIADVYGLKTFSDLRQVNDQLVFGSEYDFFEREDGYNALIETYGLRFKDTVDIDIGLKYKAISQGEIDAMIVFTTDGQLANADITILKDDLNMYPSYMCGIVVRDETIKQFPTLKKVLDTLENSIQDEDMAYMNYQVEIKKEEPKDVAKQFLVKKGLMK